MVWQDAMTFHWKEDKYYYNTRILLSWKDQLKEKKEQNDQLLTSEGVEVAL